MSGGLYLNLIFNILKLANKKRRTEHFREKEKV